QNPAPNPTPVPNRATAPEKTAPPVASAPALPSVVVLKAARVFDGRSDRMISNGVVIVEGSRIRDVGSGLPFPPQATALDLGDATLLAGFIDCHTHVTQEASDNWFNDFYEELRRSVPEKTLYAAGYARKLLESGFTTIRDVGSSDAIDVGLRNAISRGLVPGPRIVAARYAIGATGGHCDRTGFRPVHSAPRAGRWKGSSTGPPRRAGRSG